MTISMLKKISYCMATENLVPAVFDLSERKATPAYKMVEFLVTLSQKGIRLEPVKQLLKDFKKSGNVWAQQTLSLHVQYYLNTHAAKSLTREQISNLLGLQ